METIKNAIDMKEFTSDPRIDDRFICAEDGEEIRPPPQDNIGRDQKLNAARVMAN